MMVQKFALFVLFVVSMSFSAQAQWMFMKSDGDTLVRQGIEAIYNVQFDTAQTCFTKVIALYPMHPAGYFMDAMIDWWRINLDGRNRGYDENFKRKIDRVLVVCTELLENEPKNITALFFKGGALGFVGRYHALRKEYLSAISAGREALDILTECQKIAPGNHDIMLGTGIYNYYAKAIPDRYPYLAPAMMFLPPGDKELGLLQLRAAASKARYASVEAKVVLINAYYEMEQQATEAYPYAMELATRYHKNPSFQRSLGRCLVRMGKLDTMEVLWREVIVNYMDKRFGYDMYAAREALYYIGYARMLAGDYDLALQYFYKCDEACRTLDKEEASGFMVKLNMKIGQIYDVQGKRELALKQYGKVLSWKEYESSHADAERFSQTPYHR